MAKKKVIIISKKYVEAVDNGIAFLDMILGRKTWLRRMNMKNFDIKQASVCIAGNVFATALFDDSEDGFNSFVRAINTIGSGDKIAEKFGFQSNSDRGWQNLQDIWVMKITRMKKAARIA